MKWILVLLVLTGCGTTPTANLPAATPAAQATSAQPPVPSPTLILEAGWESLTWEGITLNLPPQHDWSINTTGSFSYPDTLAQAAMSFTGPRQIEAPSGMRFALIETAQTPEAWADALATANPSALDPASRQPLSVDGQVGVSFNPVVIGTGLLQTFVLQLGPNQLLVIDTDAANPAYVQVVQTLDLP